MLTTLLIAGALLAPQDHDGWVTDRAGLLSKAQERELEALMESYKQGSGHEIALLTVSSLEGQTIERLALDTARAWGIGSKESNDGALLVVALSDREMRIEVGRGLEGTLTDSRCGRIIRDVIAPEFKRERYYEGIRAGLVAMHRAAGGDYGAIPSGGRSSEGGGLEGCFGMFVFLLIFSSIFRGGRGGRGGGILPWLVLSAMSSNRGSRGFSSGGSGGFSSGGFGGGGGFSGFGGGGGFSGGGSSGGW